MATRHHGAISAPRFRAVFIIAFAALASLSMVERLSAVTIVVNTTTDEENADGDCALREAVRSAVDDAAVDACAPGSGVDEIIVPAGTYTLTLGALPDFYDETNTSLTGEGLGATIIDGNAADRIITISGSNDTTFLTIDAVTLRNGRDSRGGAISISGGNLTLMNSEVSGNQSTGDGGGINNSSSVLSVIDSTIAGNSAGNDGGGINNSSGTTILTRVTIRGNDAMVDGGGLHVSGGEVVATNSTFDGNMVANDASSEGGGIFMTGGMLTGTNLTITGNMAGPNEGGGIFISGATLNLTNSMVAYNTAGNDCGGNPVMSMGNNLDSDGTCLLAAAGDLSATDPLLGSLADNGGPTLTRALLAGSPSIDAGSNAACPEVDQRGIVRPQDGDDDMVSTCDIGAFEVGDGTPVVVAAHALPPVPRELGFADGDCVQFAVTVAAAVPPGNEPVTAVDMALSYTPLRGAVLGLPRVTRTPLRGADFGATPAIAQPALDAGTDCDPERAVNVAVLGGADSDFLASPDPTADGSQATGGAVIDDSLRTVDVTFEDGNGIFLPGLTQTGVLFVMTFPIVTAPPAGPVMTFDSVTVTTTSAMGTASGGPFSGAFTLGGFDAFARDGFEGQDGGAMFVYEGQLFDAAGGALAVGDRISGTISLSHPIAARLGHGNRAAAVVDFEMTDGTNTYTPQSGELVVADFGADDQGVLEDHAITVRRTPRATPLAPLESGLGLTNILETGEAGDDSFVDFSCMEFDADECVVVSVGDAASFGTSTGAGTWRRP